MNHSDDALNARTARGVKAGAVLIILNVILGASKLIAGIISGSISTVSDAANNLADAVSNVIIIISFILAGKKADKQHPHGHGRYEYITGMLFGVLVTAVGAEFLAESIRRIVKPSAAQLSAQLVIILSAGIAVKLSMFFFARRKAKAINSQLFFAVSLDSAADAAVTAAVLCSLIAGRYAKINILDGIAGVIVSVFIMFMGLKVIKETVDRLLGKRADSKLIKNLWDIITADKNVLGVHDIALHDYGPGSISATAHVEFDGKLSVSRAHKQIVLIENEVAAQTGVNLLIRCDPVQMHCETSRHFTALLNGVLQDYEHSSTHDMAADGFNLSFHVTIPEKYEKQKEEIRARLEEAIKNADKRYSVTINFDISF